MPAVPSGNGAVNHWRQAVVGRYNGVMASRARHIDTGAEMLVGYEQIGAFLAINPRMVGKLVKRAGLPVTLLGLNRVSTRSALLKWIEKRMEGGNAGA